MTDNIGNDVPPPIPAANLGSDRTKPAELWPKKDLEITHIIYGLMASGYVTGGLGSIAAIMLNYIKLEDVKGTPLEGHFRWQIRSFWWGTLWAVLSLLLMFALIGFVTIFIVVIWHIYRIAKGWIRLNNGKTMGI